MYLDSISSYAGGLDVKDGNTTGTEAVSIQWNGYDIIYHVSTLLPHSTLNEQQVRSNRYGTTCNIPIVA